MLIRGNKSQIWGIDVLVASAVFFIALFLFYRYYINISSTETGDIGDLIQDSKTISDVLVGEGYPDGWDQNTVVRIGLTDGNQRLNYTKLKYFSDFSETEIKYDESKKILNTNFDYLIFFYDDTGNIDSINDTSTSNCIYSVGKPSVKFDGLDGYVPINENVKTDKLIQVSRFFIYESRVYRMVLYLWS